MSIYLDAAHCRPVPRPPIWIMRQAGRYLPEYRELRDKYGFLQMVMTPEVAAEITMQPIRRFGFDAAILFSDILTVADGLGSDLAFVESKGPVISNPIREKSDLASFSSVGLVERLKYVGDAVCCLKSQLGNTPLIGFAGAPFTVASYMVEGGGSKDLRAVKQLMYTQPDTMEDLMDILVKATADYLNMQIEAGVDAIQIFDTWAGMLSFSEFQTWVIRPIKAIINRLRNPAGIPITVFAKGTAVFWKELAQLPIQVMGLDWQVDIGAMGKLVPADIALQGNLDPMLLYATPDILEAKATHILKSMAGRPGHIFNLGHGILPDVDPDQVKRLVDLVHSFEYERIHS